MKKNPLLAGVFNFILPGLGYLYSGKKRKFYSAGLFILSIWVGYHDREEIMAFLGGNIGLSEHFLLFIILYPLVFAWDAYRDVVEDKAG